MRNSTAFLASLACVLGLSFAAQADPTVTVLIGGLPTYYGGGPTTVTADFYVSLPAGDSLDGYQLSIGWDSSEAAIVGGSLINAGPTPVPGDWLTGGFGEFLCSANQCNGALSAVAGTTLVGAVTQVYIGSLDFAITPDDDWAEDIWAFDTGAVGPDYMAIGASQYTNVTFNGADLWTPEPATASLLGLGLFALAAAGRRRTRPNVSRHREV